MKLVDATYDADEWSLVPINFGNTLDSESKNYWNSLVSIAPIHPSIRDHVEDKP